ncbi:Nucleoside-diphosphate-sugar epimerase [Nocardia amikacinitolerans]|uniref:Nucleoside-diphosphate-sugar epimerase n=1 Tax=Nocardia amikacinitolerans TaxID=756689 RepID=A0A285KUA1_9NOCA|nr:NAD(P)H-binding protein [Nocardia amikacinitolerans]MCP2275837.1 Nucleoside-diphosphate-sugar epimerase [Nocardia amikacinitolerans]MCP2294109.1 Nucleoside-diphosphate-sugar epimerase [Nocardia amikacinitolerans]SNY76238.1 Nucleoside-diphosphate-sugar epimerase [Nocardia amikacinitolerans]
MRIVIAGGHGKIALLLAETLAAAGHSVTSLIRNPDHAEDVAATGARPVVLDLERTDLPALVDALTGADAVVFAAGAGPGSGAARKYTVDKGGSVLLADAAEQAGVRRFVQISTMGAGQPPAPGTDEVWAAYIAAKTQAEDDLRARDLDWTILRPGRLLDTDATGLVTLSQYPIGRDSIARADVAAVLAALLSAPNTVRTTLALVAGDTPLEDAVSAIGS